MSELNFEWIRENFDQENFVFFDVGCADLGESICIRNLIPAAQIYSFECSEHWLEKNLITSSNHRIHYFHVAVSDIDGMVSFRPSLTQRGEPHPWSGSLFGLRELNSGKVYGNPYEVKSIRLETFCKEINVTPDFIHIDVEGAEFKVFQNIGSYKPKSVWAETGAFHHYSTGTSREEFDNLMLNLGYNKIFETLGDTLYCQTGFETTPYKEK
jgi:FkbM family methyltransferase